MVRGCERVEAPKMKNIRFVWGFPAPVTLPLPPVLLECHSPKRNVTEQSEHFYGLPISLHPPEFFLKGLARRSRASRLAFECCIVAAFT